KLLVSDSCIQDGVNSASQDFDIGWIDSWEHTDAQLVAAKLAVWLNIEDAILAQDLRDNSCVDGIIEIDGANNQRARSCICNIRAGFLTRFCPVVQGGRRLGGALDHAVEATVAVHPLDLVCQHQEGSYRWSVVRLILAGVIYGSLQIQECWNETARFLNRSNAFNSCRRHCCQPQTAIGSERLLWGEVVSVDLGDIYWQSASARGCVNNDQLVCVQTFRTSDRNHCTGGGFIVCPCNDISVGASQFRR